MKTIKVEYLKFDAEQMRKESIPLLKLPQKAVSLYEKQEMKEKRRILDFVFSNSSWKGGRLTPTTENRMTHSHLRTLGHKKKEPRLQRNVALLKTGSPGGPRTPDKVVTSTPGISARLGLSHHPFPLPEGKWVSGAIEVLLVGSSTSSLCTFLPTQAHSAGFAQDSHTV